MEGTKLKELSKIAHGTNREEFCGLAKGVAIQNVQSLENDEKTLEIVIVS